MFPFQTHLPLQIVIEQKGREKRTKSRSPLRFGTYSYIRTPDFEFAFNLNGEIRYIRGLSVNWPHPSEQLKRTDGNDWVYYHVGDKSSDDGIISWMGEYYLPCLPYPTNTVWDVKYHSNPAVMAAFGAWGQLFATLYESKDRLNPAAQKLVNTIMTNGDGRLHERSKELQQIIGCRLSVLPPDTRHVDYDVIPLNISDGCLYRCKFCFVKSSHRFKKRDPENIKDQIEALKAFYGRDAANYNALFLGNHDALAAGKELICKSAQVAADAFGFHPKEGADHPGLYLFGSVDSFLKADAALFESLGTLPFETTINLGFESLDQATLDIIQKNISADNVRQAFEKMLEVNKTYPRLEVTANFILGDRLPKRHFETLIHFLSRIKKEDAKKGAVYLSPLMDSPKKRELLPIFLEIKNASNLPVFIYLIQRL